MNEKKGVCGQTKRNKNLLKKENAEKKKMLKRKKRKSIKSIKRSGKREKKNSMKIETREARVILGITQLNICKDILL